VVSITAFVLLQRRLLRAVGDRLPLSWLRCPQPNYCATLIMRMSATLILGMSWLWKTPPDGVRRGWVMLGLSRVVLRVSR